MQNYSFLYIYNVLILQLEETHPTIVINEFLIRNIFLSFDGINTNGGFCRSKINGSILLLAFTRYWGKVEFP